MSAAEHLVIVGLFIRVRMDRRYRKRVNAARSDARVRLRLRGVLLKALGPRCVSCGEERTDALTVDHVYGKDYRARRLNSVSRWKLYLEEYRSGIALRVLCHPCNSGHAYEGVVLHGSEEVRDEHHDVPDDGAGDAGPEGGCPF